MSEDEQTVRTAAEVLRARTPTMAEAVHLATRIADAVAVLHDSGHVHGRLRADEVLLAEDGAVALVGARLEIASTPVSRATDVRAVGRILAEALGADVPNGALPAGIEDLVVRAERAEDAPAAALAIALRGLERDPDAAARLLPPPVPGSYLRGNELHLSSIVPRAARGRTTVVAAVVAGIAAVGVALVVVGSPSGTVTLRPVAQDGYAGLSVPKETDEPAPTPTKTPDRWSAKQRDETLRRLLGADLTGVPDSLRAPAEASAPTAAAHRVAASPSGSASSARPAPRSPGTGGASSATPSRSSSAPASGGASATTPTRTPSQQTGGGTSTPTRGGSSSTPTSGGSSSAPTSGGSSSTPTSGGSSSTPTSGGSSSAPTSGGSSSTPTSGGSSSAPGSTTPSSGTSSSAPGAPASPSRTAPQRTSSAPGGTPTATD